MHHRRIILPLDPVESARISGLRYVSDRDPGIVRRPQGRGFVYLNPQGRPVRDPAVLRRIRSLVIPPAWRQVWICLTESGHLQAVGRDARGRKQYRYHALYRAVRDHTKFSRMPAFAAALPAIRARVKKDLDSSGLSKDRVVATVVRLLDSTAIRIGNEEYARQNQSFGLTTLRSDHVEVTQSTIHFHFRGKSGQMREMKLTDPKLAGIVRKCQHLPGQELFTYLDDAGEPAKIGSEDVNGYLREIAGEDFTAKDFRTWRGTTEMVAALKNLGPGSSESDTKKKIAEAVKTTASKLGNRPATCRKYYIHPAVINAYTDGTFFDVVATAGRASSKDTGLDADERAALALITSAAAAPDLPIQAAS